MFENVWTLFCILCKKCEFFPLFLRMYEIVWILSFEKYIFEINKISYSMEICVDLCDYFRYKSMWNDICSKICECSCAISK